MTDQEQTLLLRAAFESLISSDFDEAKVFARVIGYCAALDCPSIVRFGNRELLRKLGISRQAQWKRVDISTLKIADIKGNCAKNSPTPVDTIYPNAFRTANLDQLV